MKRTLFFLMGFVLPSAQLLIGSPSSEAENRKWKIEDRHLLSSIFNPQRQLIFPRRF
jgi:hypothetical protein